MLPHLAIPVIATVRIGNKRTTRQFFTRDL
jgi:hypothetical protein